MVGIGVVDTLCTVHLGACCTGWKVTVAFALALPAASRDMSAIKVAFSRHPGSTQGIAAYLQAMHAVDTQRRFEGSSSSSCFRRLRWRDFVFDPSDTALVPPLVRLGLMSFCFTLSVVPCSMGPRPCRSHGSPRSVEMLYIVKPLDRRSETWLRDWLKTRNNYQYLETAGRTHHEVRFVKSSSGKPSAIAHLSPYRLFGMTITNSVNGYKVKRGGSDLNLRTQT